MTEIFKDKELLRILNNVHNAMETDRIRTENESNQNNQSPIEVSGFYYDAQMSDPARTITLHPSTQLVKKDGKFSWENFPDNECFPESSSGVLEGTAKYSKTPIAVCLLSEDINVGATNDFSDLSMGNAIESAFNSAKAHAPLLQRLVNPGDGKKGLLEAVQKSKGETGGLLSSWLNIAAEKGSQFAEFASKNLNNGLFVQGSRFTVYNGSSFNFNNLEMKFIRFSEWYKVGDEWVFIPVTDYLSELASYCYGKYVPITADNIDEILPNAEDVKAGRSDKDWTKDERVGDVKEFISQFFGRQIAPGGYNMGAGRVLDLNLKGTLRLNIGNTYAVENLIIKNMGAVISRIPAKIPYRKEEDRGKTCPLYAEITLSLAPASKITDRTYQKILTGVGITKEREALARKYSNNLSAILQEKNKH